VSDLATLIKAVQSAVRTVDGLDAVPDYVPEQMNTNSMLLVYASSGVWRMGTAVNANGFRARWAVHTLTIRLHVFRKDLPSAQAKIMPFSESIPAALLHGYQVDHFAGTVVCLGDANSPGGDPLTYTFAPDDVGGQETLTYTFHLIVSTEQELPL
jgi:hypothetical protein